MSATLQVTGFTGQLKKIHRKNICLGDDFQDAWNQPTGIAPFVSINDYLDISAECLLITAGNTVTLKFTADPSGADGQGFVKIAFPRPYTMEVASKSGTVYIIQAKNIMMTDDFATVYNNPNRRVAQVGDILGNGYHILCSKNSSFAVDITLTAEPAIFPPRIIAMDDLEEGINDLNSF